MNTAHSTQETYAAIKRTPCSHRRTPDARGAWIGRLIAAVLVYACPPACWAAPAGGPATRALIEQALTEPTQVTLENVALRDAIGILSEQTGVRIEIAPDVLSLAPAGAGTVIERVELANIPLGDGLRDLFAPLGMTFEVTDDQIVIVPQEALRCLGRPVTWDELDTLAELSTMTPGVDPDALAGIRERVQFRVSVANGWERLSAAIGSVGAGSGDEVLSLACAKLGWAWCLSGRNIAISSGAELIRQRLGRPISLRMNNRPLFEVITAVGRLADVTVRAEPGALATLPLHVRKNYSLNARSLPAEQAFESIAADTGLGYLVEPDGVFFFNAMVPDETEGVTKHTASTAPGADPYVGKIVVSLEDGTSVEWLIRRSELPPDLRERREQDLQKAFDSLRRGDADGPP